MKLLEPADLLNGSYQLPCDTSQLSLVVSFNCDCLPDAELIEDLPPEVPVVIHCQLQPSFLEGNEVRRRVGSALHLAEHVVVPARFMEVSLRKHFGVAHTETISNGADTIFFHPKDDESRAAYREERGIPAGSIVIAWVAQATRAKGIQTLEHIAKILPPHTVLQLRSFARNQMSCGDYSLPKLENFRDAYEQNVRVEMEDWQPGNHPIPFADVLLVTSLKEVAPLVVTEALLSGVPVISTDCTPFYSELQSVGLGSDVQIVPLDFAATDLSRSELYLCDEEAITIAEHVAEALASAKSPSFEER